jgi:hypothetical protein
VSGTREGVRLIKRRGRPLRQVGLRILGPGAGISLGIDLLTWTLTREGNPIRVALGLAVLGTAVAAIGIGSMLDRFDRRKLGIRGSDDDTVR